MGSLQGVTMQVTETFGDLFLVDMVDYGCPYFQDGRTATVELVYPFEDQTRAYHRYLERGYCRSGPAWFANRCRGCRECVPYRLAVGDFAPTKTQRRIFRRNADIDIRIVPSSDLDEEKLDLFRRYKIGRHAGNPEENVLEEAAQVHFGYPGTFQVLYRLDGKLIGVSVVDAAADALSAHCFYHDPDCANRGLGTFSAMTEIRLARELGKMWYYLGFFIDGIRNMRYKGHFGPASILNESGWVPFPGMSEHPQEREGSAEIPPDEARTIPGKEGKSE
jgi:arginine-tRNA-protein transferase